MKAVSFLVLRISLIAPVVTAVPLSETLLNGQTRRARLHRERTQFHTLFFLFIAIIATALRRLFMQMEHQDVDTVAVLVLLYYLPTALFLVPPLMAADVDKRNYGDNE